MQMIIRNLNLPVTVFAVLLLSACQNETNSTEAELVLTNAYVYTVDGNRSIAEAVAIKDNQIAFVGSSEGAAEYIGDSTDVRDLGGAMVMPGIHDMHIHALGIVEQDMCDLRAEPHTLEQLVPVLQQCIVDYEIVEGEWLVVLQWPFSSGNEPGEAFPNIRAALDAVSTGHPIFMFADDGHHAAANGLALSMAIHPTGENIEINSETLKTDYVDFQPLIAVDANGVPTGGLSEKANLLLRPNWYVERVAITNDIDDTIRRVAAKLAESGITTIQDAIVVPEMLAGYGRLEESGAMTFRLRAAMAEPSSSKVEEIDAHIASLSMLRDQYAEYQYVSADGVKLFADSVLEGNPLTLPPTMPVAAMLRDFKQPIFGGSVEDGTFDLVGYVDQEREACKTVRLSPDAFLAADRIEAFVVEYGFYPQQCIPHRGSLEHDEPFIRAYIRKATEAGSHVHVHALSDKGVRIAVDELANVKDVADRNGTAQSLAHVQLAGPDDQKRIGELGLSVVFTFVWATPGIQYDMMVIPFIDEIDGVDELYNPGGYYLQNVYPARSIQDAGGVLVNGSDAPVGSRDPMPFVSLQQAITRSNGEVTLNENQRIDVHSAIEAFTINGARLFGHDDRLGSIETGKTADLIVLSQNVVELAESGRPHEISATGVILTVFDGRIVYEAIQNSDSDR
jgi:predicted amidohydrolase YtcJ